MKYNPKVNEELARAARLRRRCTRCAPDERVQGALALLCELERLLAEITGMDRGHACSPRPGAHGELTGHA